MIVVDVNVLLYAYDGSEAKHQTSVEWIERTAESGELLGIPWHCVMAFLRITTESRGTRRPLSLAEAARAINRWLESPEITRPEPGPRFWGILHELGAESNTRGRGWSDAYLAALAIEHGAALATFDRDFRKFKGLKLVEL
jgi:toxin-antitoxin system PIN domain toxin